MSHLTSRAAFYLLSSLTAGFLAAAIAPTPLYSTYQGLWNISPLAITVVFGSYAIAVLAALLVLGRLSDHIGRKPVLLAATLAQAGIMLLFANAHGLADLLVARVLQGIAVGGALAAIGAGLLDLRKMEGALANSILPPAGTGLGALVAGLAVGLLPAPTHLIYWAFAVLFLAQAIGIAFLRETLTPYPGALRSLKPQLAIASATRGPLLRAMPVIIASWAVAGFFASLGPAVVKQLLGTNSALLSGLTMFVLAGSGVTAVLATRQRAAQVTMTRGVIALMLGIVTVIAALSRQWSLLFFAGLVVSGAGFGAAFQGGLSSVVASAAAHERAGVLAVLFLIAYLAMGLPAMVAGWLLVHGADVLTVAREFGLFIVSLGITALVSTPRKRRTSQTWPLHIGA